MDPEQKWTPYYLGNPVYAFLLMVFFEWGVALHDLEVEEIVAGRRTIKDTKHLHAGLLRKIRGQVLKDYVLFPALTSPLFPLTLDRKSTRLNSSHSCAYRMPSSACKKTKQTRAQHNTSIN